MQACICDTGKSNVSYKCITTSWGQLSSVITAQCIKSNRRLNNLICNSHPKHWLVQISVSRYLLPVVWPLITGNHLQLPKQSTVSSVHSHWSNLNPPFLWLVAVILPSEFDWSSSPPRPNSPPPSPLSVTRLTPRGTCRTSDTREQCSPMSHQPANLCHMSPCPRRWPPPPRAALLFPAPTLYHSIL